MVNNLDYMLFLLPIVMGCGMIFRAYKAEELKKKMNEVLNGIMGAFTGVFLGHGILEVWRYNTRPELYALQSAPWYTSILVYGIFTLAVLGVCILIKAIIKHCIKSRRYE